MYVWTQQTNPLSTLTEVRLTEAADSWGGGETLELQSTYAIFVFMEKVPLDQMEGYLKLKEGNKSESSRGNRPMFPTLS